jgi:hypothetical protein
MTLEGAVDLHADVNPDLHPSTIESYCYSVADSGLGKMLVADITATQVRTAYHEVRAAKSDATANRMLRSVRAIL